MQAKILIVDDEQTICDMVSIALQAQGFTTLSVNDGNSAWLCLADFRPDLILLDWMMPKMSGIELARKIKSSTDFSDLALIMLTAKSEEDSKVTGLEVGADDYITKPFSTRELISRIKAVLRRRAPTLDERELCHHGLTIDTVSQRVKFQQTEIHLGPKEYRLLELFFRHPDRVFSREQLLDRLWGSQSYVEDRTVDVHILRLRKSLKPFQLNHLIETVRGSGYRLATA